MNEPVRAVQELHPSPGGVHPPEHKELSRERPLIAAGLPERLVLPLSQHIGAPASPVVKPGDRVLKGQVLAEARSFISAPVHAPASGTVEKIGMHPVPHPSGLQALCVTITPDGAQEESPLEGIADYRQATPATLREHIRRAGITGLGGAGFPTDVKLSPTAPIEFLVINGVECEPYITADEMLIRERAREVSVGIEILARLVSPRQVLIAIEDNMPLAAAAMEKAIQGSGFQIAIVPARYPAGGEKQLIQILLGREVPSGGLPADVGVVCQNVGTAAAVCRAVERGEPLTSRITTLTGDAVAEPGNYEVLLGTPISHLLKIGGFTEARCSRLLMGGPMMGFALEDTAVPVVKTTNCILAMTEEELPPAPPAQPCIRCGMCAEACPALLLPQQLYWFARSREHQKLEEHNLFDCIECGACAYVCPSRIPLVQYYRAAKGEILELRDKDARAEVAQQRFESHQARIAKEKEEREAARRARREATAARALKGQDPVQEAIGRVQAQKETAGKTDAPPDRAALLQRRLEKAQQRLREAGEAETAPALAATVERLRLQLDKVHRQPLPPGEETAAPAAED